MDEIQNEWICESATNFASGIPDLPLLDVERAAVDRIVGEAPVVGIGEATHGSKTIIQSTQRIMRFLIQERKADVVVLEACFDATQMLDRCVVHGEGDVRKAIAATGFWSYANEETLDFVKWLSNFNRANPGANRPVRISGCDCQSIDGPKLELMRLLQGFVSADGLSQDILEETTVLLNALPTDRELFSFVEMLIHEAQSSNPDAARIAAVETRQLEFVATARVSVEKVSHRLQEAQQALPASVPDDDRFVFDRCRRLLEQAIEFYSPGDSLNKRDLFMAENVTALRKHFQPQRLLLLAHNLHIARVPMTVRGYRILPMGSHLVQQLGSAYRAIGSAFYDGEYLADAGYGPEENQIVSARAPGPRAFEKILQQLAENRQIAGLLLDFSGSVRQRTESPGQDGIEMRIGDAGTTGNYGACFIPQKPSLQYDGIFFLTETTPITVLPEYYQHAMERWKPSNRHGN